MTRAGLVFAEYAGSGGALGPFAGASTRAAGVDCPRTVLRLGAGRSGLETALLGEGEVTGAGAVFAEYAGSDGAIGPSAGASNLGPAVDRSFTVSKLGAGRSPLAGELLGEGGETGAGLVFAE